MARTKLAEIGEGEEYDLRRPDELTYDLQDATQRKIVSWRLSCFERLGFGPTAAVALAIRRDVDREDVESMVGSGCPLDVVIGIVL